MESLRECLINFRFPYDYPSDEGNRVIRPEKKGELTRKKNEKETT